MLKAHRIERTAQMGKDANLARSDRKRPWITHAPRRRPWSPFRAHVLAALTVGALCLAAGVILATADTLIAGLAGGDAGATPASWRIVLGWAAVHLMVMPIAIVVYSVLWLPPLLVLLRTGHCGILPAALVTGSVGALWFLRLVDPVWVGALGGVVLGGVYAAALHALFPPAEPAARPPQK